MGRLAAWGDHCLTESAAADAWGFTAARNSCDTIKMIPHFFFQTPIPSAADFSELFLRHAPVILLPLGQNGVRKQLFLAFTNFSRLQDSQHYAHNFHKAAPSQHRKNSPTSNNISNRRRPSWWFQISKALLCLLFSFPLLLRLRSSNAAECS
jgi:hypothetical protein